MATNAQHQAAWRRRQKEKIAALRSEVDGLRGAEVNEIFGLRQTEADELFCMTNLYPRNTGLPMVIWVGPRYGAQHAARIKVMQTHGTQMDPENLAVVGLQPSPHLVAGELSTADLR